MFSSQTGRAAYKSKEVAGLSEQADLEKIMENFVHLAGASSSNLDPDFLSFLNRSSGGSDQHRCCLDSQLARFKDLDAWVESPNGSRYVAFAVHVR